MSLERSKSKTYNIQKMDEMLASNTIRTDHPDQRLAEQWIKEYKDNLVADALGENPISMIILCEQILKDMAIAVPTYWLIDGKQRITTLVNFRRNLFKLGNKIDRPIVEYVSVDNSGDEPVAEIKTCDVRGKRYRDLPKELQNRFDLYEVHGEMFLDCTDDDIDYHIRRYNRVKPMTAAQKGILYLGAETSRVVKRLAKHGFFRDEIGKYTASDLRNGAIDRIITDTVMTVNFLDNWKKGNNAICAYLKEHVCADAFDTLEDHLNRLECVVTEEVSTLFDNKNSFIFFSLFDRFTRYGRDDEEFIEFLSAFINGMMDTEVDGVTYNSLCEKGTKDKNTIKAKLNLLEKLMCDYLHIDKEETQSDMIVINDRGLRMMEEEIAESDIVKKVGLVEQGVKYAMLRYLSDESVDDGDLQEFANSADVTETQIEDAGFYLDLLSGWLGKNVDFINVYNLATYMRFARFASEKEVSDARVVDILSTFTGNESYEEMVASLGNQTAA